MITTSSQLLAPAWCAGVLAAFLLPERGAWGLWLAAVGSAMVLGWWRYGKRGFQAACVVAALLWGALYSLWRTDIALQAQWPHTDNRRIPLTLTVDGLAEHDDNGQVRFTAQAHTAQGQTYRLSLRDYTGRDWPAGSRWQVTARVRPPVGTRNPAGFDREAWALAEGVDGMASVGKTRTQLPEQNGGQLDRWRARIAADWAADGGGAPLGAGLMRALAVGDRSGVPPTVWAVLRPLGLNHLISISGLHITLVAVWAAWLAKGLMRWYIPARPRVWQLAVAVGAAAVYAGLAGLEVPAVRSLIMLAVLAWAWWRRGAVAPWTAWWTALTLVLLYRPASALAVGFWLSFGLVAVLLWTLSGRLPETRWRQALRAQGAAAGLGAVASAWWFGLLPIAAPLVNAVAIPWFSWLLTPWALAASLLPFASVRAAAAQAGEVTVAAMLWLGARVPEVAVVRAPAPLLVAAVLGVLVWLLPRGLRWRPLAACALVGFAVYRPPPFSGSLQATVWDVGQGLAVLLQTPSHTVLFDTGTPAADIALLPNLRAQGIGRVDALVLSHHDNDHDGGYAAIAAHTAIGTLWAGQPEFYAGARHCTGGTRWQVDGVVFEFLTPPHNTGSSDNDLSCVLRVVADGQALLLTGDLGRRGEAWLAEHYGAALFSQILILGHHGSRSATSGAFVHAVSPHIGVASSGFANPFHHPHPQVAATLSAHGARLLRTDQQGALQFTLSQAGIHTRILGEQGKRWWQRKPF